MTNRRCRSGMTLFEVVFYVGLLAIICPMTYVLLGMLARGSVMAVRGAEELGVACRAAEQFREDVRCASKVFSVRETITLVTDRGRVHWWRNSNGYITRSTDNEVLLVGPRAIRLEFSTTDENPRMVHARWFCTADGDPQTTEPIAARVLVLDTLMRNAEGDPKP